MKIAAFVPGLLLSASLIAGAQNARAVDRQIDFRGNPEFADQTPRSAPDPADFLSPTPMGPPQGFAVAPPASHAATRTPSPTLSHGDETRGSKMRAQAQQPRFKHKATRTAYARPLRLEGGQAGSGADSALSFAPVERKRTQLLPPCFPSPAFEQNGLNRCGTATPPYRGRFEELLGE